MSVDLEQARAAKKRALGVLPKAAKVNGIGITQVGRDYAVKINLAEPLQAGLSLPDRIGDVPVVVEVVGHIVGRTSKQS